MPGIPRMLPTSLVVGLALLPPVDCFRGAGLTAYPPIPARDRRPVPTLTSPARHRVAGVLAVVEGGPPSTTKDGSGRTVLVLGLCCAIALVCSLDRVLISVAIIPMAEQYAYSDTTKGAIAAAFSIGYCAGLLPTGVAASTTSPKAVLLGGLVVWSAAQAIIPATAAGGLSYLLAARALMGAGEAAAVPSLQAVAARFVPTDRRSQFWGILSASLSLGTIAAYVVSPPLIESYGWPSAFLLYGGLGGVLAVLWAALGADSPVKLSDPGTQVGRRGVDATTPAAASYIAEGGGDDAEALERFRSIPWKRVITSRPVWALAVAHSANNVFMYFGLSWLPTYFAYQFGMSTQEASSASLLPFVAGAVGALTAGVACDALVESNRFSLTTSRKIMQSIAQAGPMLAMSLLALLSAGVGGLQLTKDEAEGLFVIAVGLCAFSAAGYGCGAQDISTRYASLLYGATSVFAVIAGACGQYVTGWLLDANGRDFTPMFVLVAVVEAMALLSWNSWWSSERAFD